MDRLPIEYVEPAEATVEGTLIEPSTVDSTVELVEPVTLDPTAIATTLVVPRRFHSSPMVCRSRM